MADAPLPTPEECKRLAAKWESVVRWWDSEDGRSWPTPATGRAEATLNLLALRVLAALLRQPTNKQMMAALTASGGSMVARINAYRAHLLKEARRG